MAEVDPAATVLQAPGLVLRLDAAGEVLAAASPAAQERPWLGRCGDVAVTTATGPLALGPPGVLVDADEVETTRSGQGLRVVVRHAVEAAWTVRLVLANEGDHELTLGAVRLGWRCAPGTVATVLAAGAQAAYAVQPATGDGPVLVGRLRSGEQRRVDASALVVGPVRLPPGHRWSAQWRWEVVPDPARAHTWGDLPRSAWLDLGQAVLLPGGPDVAVVAPGLEVEVGEDSVEVASGVSGPATVELRSARGTTAYALTWAPDLDEVVDDAAGRVLGGPTTPAGTARLADAADGLVCSDVLARRSVGAPDAVAEALELLAGLLVDRLDDGVPESGPDPLALAFLARECDRTGDAPLLDAAVSALLTVRAVSPGLGLAGLGVALAQVRADRPGAAVTEHLASLLTAADPEDPAGLELALLLRPRDAAADPRVLAGLRRLGATLGAGLPGTVLPEPPLETVAHAATLLTLVDEATGQRLRRRWGVTAAELARRTAAQARARVDAAGLGADRSRATAWLVLGRPPV